MSLYDHPGSTPATPAAPAPASSDAPASSTASALYGQPEPVVDTTVSAEKRAERAADVGRALYSAQTTFGSVLPDDAKDVFTDVPAAREVAADMGLDNNDAGELLSMMRQLPNVTEDDRAKWHADSVALKIAPADLARARAFVARDPRVFDLLDRSGLGNHPAVVKRVVHLAREHAIRARR
jgi:hypothetical protein